MAKPEDLLPEQDKSQSDRLERVEHEKKKAEDNAQDDMDDSSDDDKAKEIKDGQDHDSRLEDHYNETH